MASDINSKTCIDLFAGAGGLSTGLEMAGFNTVFANEVSPVYAKSLSLNHPKARIAVGDIRDIDAKEIRKSLGFRKNELTLLAGGPPCQGFSVNAPIRSIEDRRNHLFLDYMRFVEEFSPRVVLIENVPGMISFSGGDTVRAIIGSLKDCGYKVGTRVLFAAHFGVPQMRWRTIFLATREEFDPYALFPLPTHLAKGRANFKTQIDGISLVHDEEFVRLNARNPYITVSDAISDLPEIENKGGEFESKHSSQAETDYQKLLRKGAINLYNHQCAGLGKANLDRLPHIPAGGSWRDIPHDLLPEGMKRARRSDHTKRYGRLHPEGIASTILTKCDPHWGTYIHPEQERILSVREAARLQSFPDTTIFTGKLTEQYEQVGNAVPPLFARAIGRRVLSVLEQYDQTGKLSREHFGKLPQSELEFT